MFFNARTRRSRILIAVAAAAAVVLAVAVTLAMTVTTYDHTSPRAARGKASGSVAGNVDCRKAKCVALTFDGGPSLTTPKLLDILKQDDLHATFFVQGQGHIAKYPAILRRISDEGHEIGNHTWYHEVLTDINENDARQELARTQDAIEKITGTRPILMRPPEGRTNRKVAKICRDLGLAQVLWSVTAKDYETTDSALITKRVLDQTHRDGIILLHDLHKGTVPAVPGIIKALKQRGYTIVTVSQLLAPAKPQPGMVYRP
ncbi:polysaccharide deacetylase family protein [Streptomyces mirabilis]|uniref:polysaccharide deacetylase family protein n=1 Tax=Streptomyces TaxID=1883 RepID=UPI0036C10B70